MAEEGPLSKMGFWDHVDDLRSVLIKSAVTVLAFTVGFFIFLPWLFDNVILAPCSPDFALYRFFDRLTASSSAFLPEFANQDFGVELININLASQFFIHMSTSFWLAVVFSFPFIIYFIWRFVSPGLYPNEKAGVGKAFILGTLMFYAGTVTGYFIVFPLTLRFLADYQISEAVPNVISLDSYMDNFIMLILMMGLIYELPLLAWLLGKTGLLRKSFFKKFRRHAIVVLLALAAIVTPTGDPFTLFVVFIPVYALWELSVLLVPSQEQDDAAIDSQSQRTE